MKFTITNIFITIKMLSTKDMTKPENRKFFVKGEILPKSENCIFLGNEHIQKKEDKDLKDILDYLKNKFICTTKEDEEIFGEMVSCFKEQYTEPFKNQFQDKGKSIIEEEFEEIWSIKNHSPDKIASNSLNYFENIKIELTFVEKFEDLFFTKVKIEALLSSTVDIDDKDLKRAIQRFLEVRTGNKEDKFTSISNENLHVSITKNMKMEDRKMIIKFNYEGKKSYKNEFISNVLSAKYELNIISNDKLNEISRIITPKYIHKKLSKYGFKKIEKNFSRNPLSKNFHDYDFNITFDSLDDGSPRSYGYKDGNVISKNMKKINKR